MESVFLSEETVRLYSRANALEEGSLINVSEIAGEEGFKLPVAITLAALHALEPTVEGKCSGEDLRGRLYTLFWLMRLALRRNAHVAASRIAFKLLPAKDEDRALTLSALLHSGDRGEPVITIMLPQEDR